jgi:hypothetical protein
VDGLTVAAVAVGIVGISGTELEVYVLIEKSRKRLNTR